ncbi:MAG: hypothetical protein JOZ18_09205 [Chloroflexi bacterium]|nr:hypothetical protein [Chloroflexota bacterium]
MNTVTNARGIVTTATSKDFCSGVRNNNRLEKFQGEFEVVRETTPA